jgi:predicted O-methyltransferase YrrM
MEKKFFIKKGRKMHFLPEDIDLYSDSHTEQESAILSDLDRKTHLKVLQPRMLSGHFQGRLLSMLSHIKRPKRILEIGTYTGYSALCLAEGLAEDGKVYTIDINYELQDMVKDYVERACLSDQIEMLIGDAMEIIPNLNEEFDLVFIDADKSNYINYYNLIFPKVKKNGLIIADNVLWSGKVVDGEKNKDLDTQVLIEFNKLVHEDERVQNVLLPIRDGLMVLRKK